jgi:purine-binding chemotaxis protein CheW
MNEQNQIVVFKLGTEAYGIPIKVVKEIIDIRKICSIPNVPDYIEGMINIRGSIQFIINLRKKLGLVERSYDENTKIILINGKNNGIIVDEVTEIVHMEEREMETKEEIPAEMSGNYIDGFAKIKEEIIIILNLENLISMKEIK